MEVGRQFYYRTWYSIYIYKDCFSRIYIFSPSINIDHSWNPVKDYIRDHIKPNDRETIYFDNYDASALENIINTQHKVVLYQKEQNHKNIYIKYLLL